ncbi:MAG: ABC transporter permease subunit [Phycisphaerales bacterium]|nr:ABC transporter permease [Phycisphaerae bacterium]NNF43209.1 ABC transporter permease subunit [Phycisphaerales bacterium]NNM26138.1 ABC transporter permease subunit [Phycisphaerales bacterium]
MKGLFVKSMREVWLATTLFAAGLFLVEVLIMMILPQMQADLLDEVWSQLPFVRTMITALLGTEIDGPITTQALQAFAWVHPVVLALVWAHVIILCTRVPAGEIDRGTIDVLLAWPVSRSTVYVVETAVWLGTGLVILTVAVIGNQVGGLATEATHRPPLTRVLLVAVNLACLYVAVGGVALFASALGNRRGRVIAAVFGLVVASFLLNFLAQFWTPARHVAFLGVLEYYQPGGTLMRGEVPVRDWLVLLTVGGVGWIAGAIVFSRRSICTT